MCNHANTETVTTGHEFTSYGERDDNFQETVICLDCGKIIETGASVPAEELEF